MNNNDGYNPDRYFKKYFARTCQGQDLFYVTLEDIGLEKSYYFSSSIEKIIFDEPGLNKLIKIIINKHLPELTREHFIDKLFEKIKTVPEIEKYYFQKHLLDKYGRYSEALANTYQSIIFTHKLQINVPYSPYRNAAVFDELKKSLQNSQDESNCIIAEKELFESCLCTPDLQFGYVEIFTEGMQYYFQQERVEENLLEYYFIKVNDELIFLFLVSTGEI